MNIAQAKYQQQQTLREQGYVTCPMCDGMKTIANRFTRHISECPLCKGVGLWLPKERQAKS